MAGYDAIFSDDKEIAKTTRRKTAKDPRHLKVKE